VPCSHAASQPEDARQHLLERQTRDDTRHETDHYVGNQPRQNKACAADKAAVSPQRERKAERSEHVTTRWFGHDVAVGISCCEKKQAKQESNTKYVRLKMIFRWQQPSSPTKYYMADLRDKYGFGVIITLPLISILEWHPSIYWLLEKQHRRRKGHE
jgi:hypothetical protein